MKHIVRILADDGLFIVEVPYLLTLIERTAFDTIYLEHISYFAVRPLSLFLARYGLVIQDLETNDYMGGSIRLYIGLHRETDKVAHYSAKEEEAGLYEDTVYARFSQRAGSLRRALLSELESVKTAGGRIVGVGAATKGNTLLNYCGIDSTMLEFITDSSPLKIGKYTPGSRIPIRPDEAITGDITHALILPWNIADFLKQKLSAKYPKLSYIIPHIEAI